MLTFFELWGLATIKTAIILANLGTPDAPNPAAIKRYLAEFLADPRVVNLPRSVWLPILHGVILKTRPKRLAHNYRMIWGTHDGPIRNITAALTTRVRRYFTRKYPERDLHFFSAMTYGNPALSDVLEMAHSQDCDEYLLIPLYPQYAAATTATVCDEVYRTLMKMRWQPSLQIIPHYESEP